MNKEFIKELKKLAKKYKLELLDECAYCGHGEECLESDSTCYYFTVIKKNTENECP